MKSKYLFGFLLALSLFGGLCGCRRALTPETTAEETVSREQTTEAASTETEEETTEAETTAPAADLHEGEMRSWLTGEWVPAEIGQQRPAAVMLNNIIQSTPQSNLSEAGVVYEAPVEGGITRFMALFENYSELGNIGSVRSARTYYAILQHEWDAIFCHFGQANYALPYLQAPFCENLNGLEGIGDLVYFRINWKKSPHNAYTTGDGILSGAEAKGYRLCHEDSYSGGPLVFAEEGESPAMADAVSAGRVEIGLTVSEPWYEYRPEDGLYYRYQYGGPHVDELTGEQISCRNLIIQYMSCSHYDNTEYLNFAVTGRGTGKYITDGLCIDITWSKAGDGEATHFYDLNGNELQLNPGKTWIHLVQTEREQNTKIYE